MRAPLPDTFSKSVAAVFGAEKVIVVTKGIPSQPIRSWCKSWAPPEGAAQPTEEERRRFGWLYEELMGLVKKRIANQELASVTFIWMQGEEDARAGLASVYEKSFLSLLDQFKSDLKIDKMNFVVGRINDYWLSSNKIPDGERMRALQAKMGESIKGGAWIDTDDLNTGMNPWGGFEVDGGHYPNPGYRVMGQRFARKACTLIDPNLKLNESAFDEIFLDNVKQIKSHDGIGKKITGTKPEKKNNSDEPGLAGLLDGKYGPSNENDATWQSFSAAQKTIEFVLDFEKPVDVTALGFNLFLNPNQRADLPKKLSISISENGTDFTQVGKNYSFATFASHSKPNNPRQPFLVYLEIYKTTTRYIKIEIETNGTGMLMDEIVINPVVK